MCTCLYVAPVGPGPATENVELCRPSYRCIVDVISELYICVVDVDVSELYTCVANVPSELRACESFEARLP